MPGMLEPGFVRCCERPGVRIVSQITLAHSTDPKMGKSQINMVWLILCDRLYRLERQTNTVTRALTHASMSAAIINAFVIVDLPS